MARELVVLFAYVPLLVPAVSVAVFTFTCAPEFIRFTEGATRVITSVLSLVIRHLFRRLAPYPPLPDSPQRFSEELWLVLPVASVPVPNFEESKR